VNTILLDGVITPDDSSPLATAPMRPENEADLKGKYSEGGKDIARLPRMRIATSGGFAYTPYCPAAAIRRALRNAARNYTAQINGQKWGLDVHRYLTIGGVKGSDKEGIINPAETEILRQRLPIISLFGASSDLGNPWVAGKLAVSHAIPDEPIAPTIITGVRSDPIKRDTSEIQYLDDETVASYKTIAANEREYTTLNRELKELNTKAKISRNDEYQGRIAELENLLQELRKSVNSDVSVGMPLAGYEVIPPGVPLKQNIRLTNATTEEIGLLFKALKGFACHPVLGAHYAQGCGFVKCRWTVKKLNTNTASYETIGTLSITPLEGLMMSDAVTAFAMECETALEAAIGQGHVQEALS